MLDQRLTPLRRQLRKLRDGAGADAIPDALLLDRFVTAREEAAFEALLARHGPMVMSVCRRVLREASAVDDAFQATFLVLARKAGAIRRSDLLANWLYGVAYRTAKRAGVNAAKRRAREQSAPARPAADPLDALTARELLAVLDEELNCLPAAYRGPLVLCYLEGRTRDQAARQAGCSRATLERRLERGRVLLRNRLARRGLTLGLALSPALLPPATAAAGPAPSLTAATLEAATAFSSGSSAHANISPAVKSLMEGVLRTMSSTKRKIAVVALVVLALVTAGVGGLMAGVRATSDPSLAQGSAPAPGKPKPAAGKPQPPGEIAVFIKGQLYEVDDAFHMELAKAKFLTMADLEKLENDFLNPPKDKPPVPEADSLFNLLEKQKQLVSGKEFKVGLGKDASLLTWQKKIKCLPNPDQVRKGDKTPQVVTEGVSFHALVQITPDRRFVKVKLTEKSAEIEAIEKVKLLLDNTETETVAEVPAVKESTLSQLRYIPDGGTLLLPVQYRPAALKDQNRWLVLCIQARIYIKEEEKAINGEK